MARKSAPKKTSKTAKSVKARRPAGNVRKAAAKKAKSAATPGDHKIQPGFISHTELTSMDPSATKVWASKVFGWKIQSVSMPDGSDYHMWQNSSTTGGGIRVINPPEMPGTVPYVEVASMKVAYTKAIKLGAKELMPPQQIMQGRWIAVVQAPGGPAIGLYANK